MLIPLLIGPWVQTSVYDVPVVDFHFQAVLTNTASTGAYRGAGRPEAIFIMERLMDEAARQTGIDRIELRRRNFIQPEQMPYKNPMGQVYDVGRSRRSWTRGWRWPTGAASRRAPRRARRRASCAAWASPPSSNGPAATCSKSASPSKCKADGVIEVFSAVNQMGQGIATTLAQLVVDVFGVPMEQGARGAGRHRPRRRLRQRRLALAVHRRLGAAPGRGEDAGPGAQLAGAGAGSQRRRPHYSRGRFTVKGTDVGIDLFELAGKQPEQRIFMDHTSTVAGPSWPNGCHISEVEIDPRPARCRWCVQRASTTSAGW
jgi:carbon-monoxide dehydrogenase large subunit